MNKKTFTVIIGILAAVALVVVISSIPDKLNEREMKHIKEYCRDIDEKLKTLEFYVEQLEQTDNIDYMDMGFAGWKIYYGLCEITECYENSKQKEKIIETLKETMSKEELNMFLNEVESCPDDYYLPFISDDILNMYE